MPLVDRVRQTIRRFRLASADTGVVAALSGGPDSVALVHVLRELSAAGDLRLVALAHLNHQLRTEADDDERFCRALAANLDVPISVARTDVAAQAANEGRSIEDAAHRARYAFFEQARAAHGADVVALGHTADDQAETFLLRLLRGAGARGLGGMHPRSGIVIRPVLECRRAELRAFLDTDIRLTADPASGPIPYLHDASNDDVGIPRNRVRVELIPLLERRFNPAVVDVLARDAEIARAEHEYLDGVACAWWDSHAHRTRDGVAVDRLALAGLSLAVGRRALVHGLASLGSVDVGFDDVDRAWRVVCDEAEAADLHGVRVERRGGTVVLISRPAGPGRYPSAPVAPKFLYTLPVPGEVQIRELGCVISAEVADARQAGADGNASIVAVALDRIGPRPLGIRNRRPGDRLRPTPVGRRKLQDLLVDRKVPRDQRDRIPIVVDGDDRIVWVAGHAIDQDFRVMDPAQAVVILRLKGGGGSF